MSLMSAESTLEAPAGGYWGKEDHGHKWLRIRQLPEAAMNNNS